MTESPSIHTPDQVTVLVFKDNYASRTFQIPLKWFGRFGMLLGAMAGLTFLSLFFALKYYQVAKTADPVRLQELEAALVDLKARVLAPAVPAEPVKAPTTQTPSQSAAPKAAAAPLLYTALPPLVAAPPANPNAVPITIHAPVVRWNGKILTVRFELQYNLLDRGSQQGRILLFARGPSTLLSYPAGAFNVGMGAKDSLIDPEKGEYFSVSRIRAVEANFGPMPAGHEINQLEVLILSSTFQILIHQMLPVEGAKPMTVQQPPPLVTAPAPAPTAEAEEPKAKPRPEPRKPKVRAKDPAPEETDADDDEKPSAPDATPAEPETDNPGTTP